MFSCVSAAAGTGAQGGVSNSTGSLGSSMDGAAGITSTAGPSVTATQSQSKSDAASGVVMVTLDATAGAGRPGATDAQTLNGGAVVMNCQITAGGPADSNNSQPGAVTLFNNGPVSVSKPSAAGLPGTPSTIIRATLNAQNVVTSSVISSQPSVKTVPTITLVRPPMQTSMNPLPSTGSPTTPSVSVTSTTGSPASKTDCPKVILPTGAHVVASVVATGTTATVRSPTVLQGLRTSVPSTVAATPPGGIRTIVPQVLAPRLAQPQQNAPNIQNIQLPPGN